MSNKKPPSSLFKEKEQKIYFAIILIACLLLIIGVLNLDLESTGSTINHNNKPKTTNQTDNILINSPVTYSRSGKISNLLTNQIELLVNQLGQTARYIVLIDEETSYYSVFISNPDNLERITFSDLAINDTILVMAQENIQDKQSFLASTIERKIIE